MTREVSVKGITAPIGMPITYNGAEVGRVTGGDQNGIIGVVDSDIVHQIMGSNKVSYSLEVIKE